MFGRNRKKLEQALSAALSELSATNAALTLSRRETEIAERQLQRETYRLERELQAARDKALAYREVWDDLKAAAPRNVDFTELKGVF